MLLVNIISFYKKNGNLSAKKHKKSYNVLSIYLNKNSKYKDMDILMILSSKISDKYSHLHSLQNYFCLQKDLFIKKNLEYMKKKSRQIRIKTKEKETMILWLFWILSKALLSRKKSKITIRLSDLFNRVYHFYFFCLLRASKYFLFSFNFSSLVKNS